MKRIAKSVYGLTLATVITVPCAALAHDPAFDGAPKDHRSAPAVRPTIDPLLQALIIGLAAAALREAAESPDPIATFGSSIERKLMFALRSPELSQLAEQMIAEAVKDAPEELREPLAQFATAMLKSLRREMLDNRQSQRIY